MTGVALTERQKLFDKSGREIVPGDVLKVFHFIGARRKRHYMLKQAMEYVVLPMGNSLLYFSHLDLSANGYWEIADGRTMADYEIVQSVDSRFEERPRRTAALEARCKPELGT